MEVISYSLKELSDIEKKAPRTIKNSDRYIKIRIETKSTIRRAKIWLQKKSYSYRYIRLEDIKNIYKNKIDFTYITK